MRKASSSFLLFFFSRKHASGATRVAKNKERQWDR
jgi:hypothetical protein